MLHRHPNHQRLTLAAIDDVIARGRWQDWADLRRAVLQDRLLLGKKATCAHIATVIFDRVCELGTNRPIG